MATIGDAEQGHDLERRQAADAAKRDTSGGYLLAG